MSVKAFDSGILIKTCGALPLHPFTRILLNMLEILHIITKVIGLFNILKLLIFLFVAHR
jgi:hypothetical protein